MEIIIYLGKYYSPQKASTGIGVASAPESYYCIGVAYRRGRQCFGGGAVGVQMEGCGGDLTGIQS